MNYNIILLLLGFLCFGVADKNSVLKRTDCDNDICVKEADTRSKSAINTEVKQPTQSIYKIFYSNLSENQNRNENLMSDFEESLDNETEVNNPEDKRQKKYSIDSLDTMELYSSNPTENFEEVTFTEFILKDVDLSVTTENENKLHSTTLLTKFNTTTTPTPQYELKLFKAQSKNICFCDLTVNECDINCCCDQDCTSFHFKVFTKCNDIYSEIDSKYCFQSNFIFENHTVYKMFQNKGGMFCIITDNLPMNLDYQKKPFITTLRDFNKNMPKKSYKFFYKSAREFEFSDETYKAGSYVWIVQNGQLKPFRIPIPFVGSLCASQGYLRYLVDEFSVCYNPYQPEGKCGSSRNSNMLHYLKDIKIISNPGNFNKSTAFDSAKNCKAKSCIGLNFYLCQYVDKVPTCVKLENSSFFHIECLGTVADIKYQIWHNYSKGIATFEVYVWFRNPSENQNGDLVELRTEVKHLWVGSGKVFHKSGNPGYITGKAVLAGKKIYNSVNDSVEKKEAIELSLNPQNWLSILGSEKGICSSKLRTPIKFRENGQYMCSLKLTKDYFHKDKCTELQNNIFKLLIGSDIINMTRENFYNKFVATFGNSKVEETGDWVQVLTETISNQAVFKSSYFRLICKNVVTDLHISVVYSNIGSFSQPQSKILGVSMHFGEHKDLIFNCDNPSCDSPYLTREFKLTTFVQFVDVTKPAFDAFAEPLTLETRLPHDFFYPFFSKSSKSQFLSKLSLILIISVFV